MTIKTLIGELGEIAAVALTDYLVIFGTKQYYETTSKVVPDKVIVIEPPVKWPINVFSYCEKIVDIDVYIGRNVSINEVGASLYDDTYIFDNLITDLNLFISGFTDSTKVQIIEDPVGELFDPDKGESVNNTAYLKATLKLKISG